jgi:hypothetical protein
MHFILEESSWAWDGEDRLTYIEQIERLLDRLDVADERGEGVTASRELLEQKIAGAPLAEVLWQGDGPLALPHEVKERLTPHLSRLDYWDDTAPYLEFEATIAGALVISPSAVYAHAHAHGDSPLACLPLPGRWSGPCAVQVGERAVLLHFVTDEASHRAYFRALVDRAKLDEAAIADLAPHAYPNTYFLEGVWRGLRDFSGGLARARGHLLRFLAVFDDHGAWVFGDLTGRLSPAEPVPSATSRVPVTNALIEKRFLGWGLDLAPEKHNVRDHAASRRARTRTLAGESLYCEWHYKLEGHTNRVHVHPPTKATQGRPIVAIFADHLPLPGD